MTNIASHIRQVSVFSFKSYSVMQYNALRLRPCHGYGYWYRGIAFTVRSLFHHSPVYNKTGLICSKDARIQLHMMCTQSHPSKDWKPNVNVRKDTLIYTVSDKVRRDLFYMKATLIFFGLVPVVNLLQVCAHYLKRKKEKPDEDLRQYMKLAGCYFGLILLLVSISRAIMRHLSRTVAEITLKQGGKEVQISHFPVLFGPERCMVVPVNQIRGIQHRNKSKKTPLQVKDTVFILKEGTYHNPSLYDHHIGLDRELK